MAGKSSGSRNKGKARAISQSAVPDVYREMLAEALPLQPDIPERPLKRRRIGRQDARASTSSDSKAVAVSSEADDDDEDLQFEDVFSSGSPQLPGIETSEPPEKVLQTAYRDSDEESEGSDIEWEGGILDSNPANGGASGDLELTLSKPITQRSTLAARRHIVSKAERALRLQIHKMHVLCLLSHVDRRNNWCNDSEVQRSLKPLLDKNMLKLLHPRSELSQFGRAESLKKGLDQVAIMWRKRFAITASGMRKALWADVEEDLKQYKLPDDADPPLDKSDFRAAAKSLKGSRDLGAHLFCALLRSVGVETRLVCSLQPLSFNSGGPAMPRPSIATRKGSSTPNLSDEGELVDIQASRSPFGGASGPSTPGYPFLAARRRLGHPNAADYHMPDMSIPTRVPSKPRTKVIHETPYPVYWVEVLDEAHQKWFPVDPVVSETVAKTRVFEPPASDRENSMSYVVAFEEEGSVRDVTRRYAKAYNSKTRKNRVESTEGGEKWWRKTMRAYSRGWTTDLDQIEDIQLADTEAREPMPKNVADFKSHPTYALERHLRKNEVLVSSHIVGKLAAGRDPTSPGGKKLENIYRRRDVKVARSADAWYRLGREVKMGEMPVKTVEASRKPEDDDTREDVEERAGTNLYTESQTELYQAPPVVNGRIPKNSYGNLDIFVPSMVPPGGVHLLEDEAARSARILGIDYAEALTGFKFQGRHGTAVLKGVVVAAEYRAAMETVIEGFQDERLREEEDVRMVAALRMWKRFLMALRIRERIDAYEVEGEEKADTEYEGNEEEDDYHDRALESEEYFEDGAGGFFPE